MNPLARRADSPAPLSGARLNSLRAGVLGANDGIVSVAAIVVGVAGASSSRNAVVAAGVAGLVAGALSMAAGEYVSVSSQRDAEQAADVPADAQTNPWHAAGASLTAFLVGGIMPLLVVLVPWPSALTVPVVVMAVVLALVATGWLSARVGGASPRRAVVRNVLGGALAMAVTFGVGTLMGLAA
ncbi:VIT1/CCC1 transporter family protein [Cellulomonas sp. URHE0023]|uniref:VIT1/CCC1 transporter family protein n=1 Tax=Cellulomonas sp. URHE0023 TaxID=1380354 RepID=UPI00068E28D9|nr:VIT1/CCC1 transporter family protein [Cellulomonas sp. URHE0023]